MIYIHTAFSFRPIFARHSFVGKLHAGMCEYHSDGFGETANVEIGEFVLRHCFVVLITG